MPGGLKHACRKAIDGDQGNMLVIRALRQHVAKAKSRSRRPTRNIFMVDSLDLAGL